MKRKPPILPFFVIISLSVLFVLIFNDMRLPQSASRPDYLSYLLEEAGALNAVTAIYLDYRIYDTLFEITVFFIAAFGVSLFLSRVSVNTELPSEDETNLAMIQEGVSFRLGTASNIIFLLAQLFGIYVMMTGHLGPGGGFVGGVISGTGILVLVGSKKLEEVRDDFKRIHIHTLERYVLFAIPLVGIIAFVFSGRVYGSFLPLGEAGTVFSGGAIPLMNFLIGFKVFAGTWTILYHFVQHRGAI